jgi:hypothetical protein
MSHVLTLYKRINIRLHAIFQKQNYHIQFKEENKLKIEFSVERKETTKHCAYGKCKSD